MKNLISIREYPYGRVTVRLRKAVKWINSHQRTIKNRIMDEEINAEFDYPDYWGMPKSICNKLSSDEVDFIQSQVAKFSSELYAEALGVESIY